MCPHSTIYLRPHTIICVLILLYMCPHPTMCPHTTMCPNTTMCPHTTICVLILLYVSLVTWLMTSDLKYQKKRISSLTKTQGKKMKKCKKKSGGGKYLS